MIQGIVLPEIAFAQEQQNAKKEDHDVLEPPVGRPRGFDPMIQNIILPQIALAQEQKRQEGRPRCFGNPFRETKVF